MNAALLPHLVQQIEHASLAALREALAPHAVWFHVPVGSAVVPGDAALAARLAVHRCGPAAALVLDGLGPADLPALRELSAFAFLARPTAALPNFGERSPAEPLWRQGFRCFFSHMSGFTPARASHIGTLEFLVSATDRLARFPGIGSGWVLTEPHGRPPVRLVFILDLVQDFEVLRPLMAMAARPFGPFQPVVSVSERIRGSHLWQEVQAFLNALNLPHFRPLGPADVAAALGSRRSLLITAAETSASAHSFGHDSCRSAPPRALRATFQHGYECIGLRHHRAHDLQFPQGLRFASDLVFVWMHEEQLTNLHPADRDRCRPVGVTKQTTHRAALLLESEWLGAEPALLPASVSQNAVIVAENLHSDRFSPPHRYQRYLHFVEALHDQEALRVVMRSHPGKRTLEKARKGGSFVFLEGSLAADHFMASQGVVSAASTILLDAALCMRPAAVWTDMVELGDVENYEGLPVVEAAEDVPPAMLEEPERKGLSAFAWGIRNTAAIDGHSHAWRQLCGLFN